MTKKYLQEQGPEYWDEYSITLSRVSGEYGYIYEGRCVYRKLGKCGKYYIFLEIQEKGFLREICSVLGSA